MFTARMDVEALSNDTLVAFGRQYAREMEYSIDELGVLGITYQNSRNADPEPCSDSGRCKADCGRGNLACKQKDIEAFL